MTIEDTDEDCEETEGICDDCNGPMQQMRDNIWYCPHCEIFFEWMGSYNVIADEDIAEKLEAELESELRHDLSDIAAIILSKSNDGKDLKQIEMGLVQCAINNYLNEEGLNKFRELHDKMTGYRYSPFA